MAIIKVNTDNKVRKMKPMHGVNEAPMWSGDNFGRNFHYLKEAGIPISRIHDVGGSFGGAHYADIPNIFPNFDADVNDPASYDFAFTDRFIAEVVKADVEPYYRLGVTIEGNAGIRSYHLDPPKDYQKWAQICEHVIAHYIDGWANGFHYNIKYWEIWNEPDDGMREASQMWNGTKEDYYRLYEVTAKHLKRVFGDRIKVGGYGAISLRAGVAPEEFKDKPRGFYFLEFFRDFLKYNKEHNCPFDFFSWHAYNNTVMNIVAVAKFVRKELDEMGFTNTENHMNEWNIFHNELGTALHSTGIISVMMEMQKAPLDVMTFYQASAGRGRYGGLFEKIWCTPIHGYYSFVAFNHLYQLGTEVETSCDTENVHVCAASDGEKGALVIANMNDWAVSLDIQGVDLKNAKCHLIDQSRLLSWSPMLPELDKKSVLMIEF